MEEKVYKIQHRADTAANWELENPVLLLGEYGHITDSAMKDYKIGDGKTHWNDLPKYTQWSGEGVSSLDGYLYMGVAMPELNPGTPKGKVFYLASKGGNYTNFGNVAVSDGTLTALTWDGKSWKAEALITAGTGGAVNLTQEISDAPGKEKEAPSAAAVAKEMVCLEKEIGINYVFTQKEGEEQIPGSFSKLFNSTLWLQGRSFCSSQRTIWSPDGILNPSGDNWYASPIICLAYIPEYNQKKNIPIKNRENSRTFELSSYVLESGEVKYPTLVFWDEKFNFVGYYVTDKSSQWNMIPFSAIPEKAKYAAFNVFSLTVLDNDDFIIGTFINEPEKINSLEKEVDACNGSLIKTNNKIVDKLGAEDSFHFEIKGRNISCWIENIPYSKKNEYAVSYICDSESITELNFTEYNKNIPGKTKVLRKGEMSRVKIDSTTNRINLYSPIQLEKAELLIKITVDGELKIPDKSDIVIVNLGDSITDHTGPMGSYSDILRTLSNMDVICGGIGGSCAVPRIGSPLETFESEWQAFNNLDLVNLVDAWAADSWNLIDIAVDKVKIPRFEKIISNLKTHKLKDVDVITIMIGGNDILNGHQLGTVDSIRTSEYCGAINHVIDKIYSVNKGVKIYLFTNIVKWIETKGPEGSKGFYDDGWSDVWENVNGESFRSFNNKVFEIAKRYHLPCCDMYDSLGFNKTNFLYYFANPDGTTDGSHPYNGYDVIANRMWSFMTSNNIGV